MLNKVVSRDIAEELMKGDVELGGENRHVTVLFADIRGFTALTEGMEPQEVIGFLNECMERLRAAVEEEGGVVDKFVGDELMAVFGAPIAQGDDASRAVRAALRMRDSMTQLNVERIGRGDASIGLGIGLSTGLAVAGNMGSRERLNYTVLGDIVNLGARLCSGAAAGEILITENTRDEAADQVEVESRGAQSFKGFSRDIEVFAVLGPGDDSISSGLDTTLIASLLLAGSLAWMTSGPPPLAAQEWPSRRTRVATSRRWIRSFVHRSRTTTGRSYRGQPRRRAQTAFCTGSTTRARSGAGQERPHLGGSVSVGGDGVGAYRRGPIPCCRDE